MRCNDLLGNLVFLSLLVESGNAYPILQLRIASSRQPFESACPTSSCRFVRVLQLRSCDATIGLPTEPNLNHQRRMGLMGRGDERSSSDRVVKGDRKRLRKLEKKRVKQIMKCISVSEVALPVGMHGYHRDQGVFVCWLPGYDAPVAADTAQRHAIESDWHKDKKIGVKLKWHADGFYTMRRRDSAAFIAQHTSDPPAAATTTATDYPTRAFKRTGSIATTADDADQEPASKRSKKEQKTRKALSSAQIEGHATVAAPAKVVAALTRRFSEVETEQSESEGDDYDRFNSRKRLKWTPAMVHADTLNI